MIVFTKNVLCQLAEFPHVFSNSGSSRLEYLSRKITLTIKMISKQISNTLFSGKKKMIYDLDFQWRQWLTVRDEQYQTIVDILNEILVSELEKIFIDSNIYTEIKTVTDVYDNESQHNILVIDWN